MPMRPLLCLILATSLPCGGLGISVTNLRAEYLENPLGLDKAQPRFQWEISGGGEEGPGVVQVSYRIRVGTTSADGSIWDSKPVTSAQNYQIKYGGAPLTSGGFFHWSVSVVTKPAAAGDNGTAAGVASAPVTSAPAHFSIGMLSRAAWGAASFIGMPPAAAALPTSHVTKPPAPPPPSVCPWFRKAFTLPADADLSTVGAALVSVGSVGYHELYVNGQPASDGVLLPSVSYLPKRVLYRSECVILLQITRVIRLELHRRGAARPSAAYNECVAVMHSLRYLLPPQACWRQERDRCVGLGGLGHVQRPQPRHR